MTLAPLPEPALEKLRSLLRKKLGIVIPATLSTRASRELQDYVETAPGGWRGVIASLEAGPGAGPTLKDLADIFTITHTYFFREPNHFDFLKDTILPGLSAANVRDIRIWSAAAASGEEAYSILLTMIDYYGAAYWSMDAGVLATDISRRALARADDGVYHDDALRHVPDELTRRWFSLEERGWRIDEKVRKEAVFRWLNLAEPFPSFQQSFHVIFCRNVMLYFDDETRAAVIEKLACALAPGGWLIIGQAEDSRPARRWLEPVGGSIYYKPPRG